MGFKIFNYISGIDLDLDKKMEALTIDSAGNLYGFNSDLILMAGFPFEKKFSLQFYQMILMEMNIQKSL